MRVVLATPGVNTRAKGIGADRQAPFSTQSLGLGYLAAALEAHGIEAEVVDGHAAGWTWEQSVERALGFGPDVLGVSVTNASARAASAFVARARERGLEGAIVLGGWEASLATAELMGLCPGADAALRGEAEASLPALVRAIEAHGALGRVPAAALARIPGLVWREEGRLRPALAGPGAPTFEALPWPRRPPGPPGRLTPVQSSRGCAFGRCTFCTTPALEGRRWRALTAEAVVAELVATSQACDTRRFIFVDDEFVGPSRAGFDRAADIGRRLVERDADLELTLDVRVNDYRPDLFDLLQRAGLRRVFLGIESGSDAVLRRMEKGYTAEVARTNLLAIERQGLDVLPGYILFEPYMSLPDVREAFEFLAQVVPRLTPTKFLNRLVPYVGTPAYASLAADGLLRSSYPSFDFAFRDPAVERLYDALDEQLAPVVERYRALVAAGARTRDPAVQSLVAATISVFDALLTRHGA